MSRFYSIKESAWRPAKEGDSLPSQFAPEHSEVYLVNGHQVGAAGRERVMFSQSMKDGYCGAMWRRSGGRFLGDVKTIGEARALVTGAVRALVGLWFGCERCGAHEDDSYTTSSDLRKRERCHHCAFWEDRTAELTTKPGTFVADGRYYTFGDKEPNEYELRTRSSCYGFGGAGHRVRFLDGRPTRETHNLWTQGEVPSDFREQLPDTATLESIR
jgi:hypothetical protein